MLIRSLTAITAGALLLSACMSNETANSDTVKQSEIYQNYSVSWAGDAQSFVATAGFRFGGENGTTLHLVDPSEVKFNGRLMHEEKLLFGGRYYEYKDDNYQAKSLFRFTDHDGKVYENVISFEPVEFAENPKTADKSTNLEIALNRAVNLDEGVKLSVVDTANAYSATISATAANAEVYYDAAKSKLVVTPAFFRTMADVPLTLTLESSFTENLQQAAAKGGEISFSYVSRSIKVERKEAN